MRTAPPLLAILLLALLAAPAHANGAAQLRVEPRPFAEPVAPLQAHGVTDVTVTGACGDVVELDVLGAPAWAATQLSPASLRLDDGACEEGAPYSTEVRLTAALSAAAPAFRPANLTVRAVNATGANATGVVAVTASYFGTLEVTAVNPILQVKPGEDARFILAIANHGNGATWVAVEPQDATGGVTAPEIPPFLLESAQQGGTAVARNVTVPVGTSGGFGYVNEVGVATYRVRSWSADDANVTGDTTTVSFLATQKGLDVPGPAPLALLAAALVATLALRRR